MIRGLLFFASVIAAILIIDGALGVLVARWMRGRVTITPQTPAGGEDPAATPRDAPDSPLPGHQHGGLDMTIRLYHCGCIHYIGRRQELVDVMPCSNTGIDWDAWKEGLTP